MNRESFIFYRSFFDSLVGMDDATQGRCLMAMADYALNGMEPVMTPEVRMFFTLVKPQIDANNKRYENGSKGGRPKNQNKTKTKPNDNQNETELEPNVNDNVNDNAKKENILKEKNQKPTLQEVIDYCQERNNGVDANKWFDYYTANGWKVGRNPMKDWKATVRTWERNNPHTTQQVNDEDANLSREERFQLFLKRCGVKKEGGENE